MQTAMCGRCFQRAALGARVQRQLASRQRDHIARPQYQVHLLWCANIYSRRMTKRIYSSQSGAHLAHAHGRVVCLDAEVVEQLLQLVLVARAHLTRQS